MHTLTNSISYSCTSMTNNSLLQITAGQILIMAYQGQSRSFRDSWNIIISLNIIVHVLKLFLENLLVKSLVASEFLQSFDNRFLLYRLAFTFSVM